MDSYKLKYEDMKSESQKRLDAFRRRVKRRSQGAQGTHGAHGAHGK